MNERMNGPMNKCQTPLLGPYNVAHTHTRKVLGGHMCVSLLSAKTPLHNISAALDMLHTFFNVFLFNSSCNNYNHDMCQTLKRILLNFSDHHQPPKPPENPFCQRFRLVFHRSLKHLLQAINLASGEKPAKGIKRQKRNGEERVERESEKL